MCKNTFNKQRSPFIYLTKSTHFLELNLKQAVLHQLGHAAGLHHSDHPQSVMYPFYRNVSDDSQLHPYDVTLIRRLYGLHFLHVVIHFFF